MTATKQILKLIIVFSLADAFGQVNTGAGTQVDQAVGVEKVGGPVSAPDSIYAPSPEYSQEARDAKYQGTCVLWLVVDTDGHTRNIKVTRALGHGLDQRAVEAVKQWRFKPAMKDGTPVAVQINVEVRFRLYDKPGTTPNSQMDAHQSSTSPTPASNYLDVGDVRLWYEECGAANLPAVVLLHDGLVHSITWDGVWAPLCAKHHVVRYDRRGYGRSDAAKTPFIPEDDLNKMMRQVHMDRAIIVGNSSGGGLALDFALAHPEMVDALLLIGPVVHGMASSDYFNERGNQNNAPMAKGDLKAVAENWSKDRFLISGNDQRARAILYDALLKSPQNLKVAGGLEIRPSPPTVSRLSQIRVPTLVLVGDADIADVFAYSGAIEAAVPLATFGVWKDTGHLIQIQKPAELVTRFNQFVRLVERKEVDLSQKQLNSTVGQYQVGKRVATVSLKDNRLLVELPGDPYYWLFAASDTRFFLRTDETEIEFQKDAAGKVIEMVVHNSDGSVIQCPRVSLGMTP